CSATNQHLFASTPDSETTGFSCLLELLRQLGVSNLFVVEAGNFYFDAVFDLNLAEVVHMPAPSRILRQIVGDAFGKQDVTGVAAIHHALSDVNANASDVIALVHIGDGIDWSAMKSHA